MMLMNVVKISDYGIICNHVVDGKECGVCHCENPKKKKGKMKTLTDKEKLFAKLYVENLFSNQTQTNTDIAIQSGYARDSAHQRAYEILRIDLNLMLLNT